jgi:LPXTG-site transpeptidase (sortase) family protein
MAENPDTLDINSLRRHRDTPAAPTPGNAAHTDAKQHFAAAARARIAAIPDSGMHKDYALGAEDQMAPATPTADLIVDKAVLAQQMAAQAKPLVHHKRLVPTALVPFLTAAGVFVLVLLLFKAPVVINQIQYSLNPKPPVAALTPPTDVVPAANTISISKLNLTAPVGYVSSIQEADIQRALQDGVVHYGNTALPGTAGNVAIFGHSSNDWWEPGNYKFVFVLLDKLTPGDQVTLDYQSKRYVYEVTGSKVVEPTDVGVLNPTATPTLTLITCTPPGTSLKRLVVTAKQVSPDPSHTAVAANTPASQTPATLTSSPNFLDQIAQAINGIFTGIFGGGNAPSASPAPANGEIPAAK